VLCTALCHSLSPTAQGHETTAATLGWTLYYIAKNPEVERKVLAELQAVMGDRFEPRAEDIPKLVRPSQVSMARGAEQWGVAAPMRSWTLSRCKGSGAWIDITFERFYMWLQHLN
jgi:cytochrome P450